MKALRQQIALTAPTNGRVLIYGESGTGKELVARALHASSSRSAMPFVEVNCAAIPEELIESEMFGHRKGSFTGASEDKVGKFQKADGGTLFLDEVGDMSLKTQSKVLRVLEEQRVEPLGSNQPVTVDVRVIAATNKKLEEEIGAEYISRGSFLPAERDSLLRAGVARADGGYSGSGGAFSGGVLRGVWEEAEGVQSDGDGRAVELSVAGKRARAEESGRAAGDYLPFAAD